MREYGKRLSRRECDKTSFMFEPPKPTATGARVIVGWRTIEAAMTERELKTARSRRTPGKAEEE